MPSRRRRKFEFELLLLRAGLSATGLATRSRVSVRTIHAMRTRSRRRTPWNRTVSRVARALRVSRRCLLDAIGAPTNGNGR